MDGILTKRQNSVVFDLISGLERRKMRRESSGRFSQCLNLNEMIPRMNEKHFGIARILNKRGFCSRAKAESLVCEGRVAWNGKVVVDPETPVPMNAEISVDGVPVLPAALLYFALNKPRGIVATASDERGRKTVLDLVAGKFQQHVFPVGRLDKASEGLLLMTNDTAFADRILSPKSHLEKEYHVQIHRKPSDQEMRQMQSGVLVPPRVFGMPFEKMRMERVKILRCGKKTCWLSVVLNEGKNREIRRILEFLNISVLRLVRVRIGKWTLGNLKPGEIRRLSLDETGA